MPRARFSLREFILLAALPAVLFLSGGTASAENQPKGSVTLAPSKIAITLDQGKQSTIKISAINKFQTPVIISQIDAWDFAIDSSGNPTPISAEDAEKLRGAGNWMQVPGKPITINPGQKVTFPVIINVPKTARDGTHYAFVRATIVHENQQKDSVKVNLQINTLVLVTVGIESNPARLRRKTTVSDFEVPGIVFKSLAFSGLIFNEGNVHETVEGNVELYSGNQKVAKVPLGKHLILPGTKYKYKGDWEQRPFFGKYTAKATFTGGPKRITVSRDVWVVSANSLLTVAAVLVLLIWLLLFLWRFSKNFKIVRKEDG